MKTKEEIEEAIISLRRAGENSDLSGLIRYSAMVAALKWVLSEGI